MSIFGILITEMVVISILVLFITPNDREKQRKKGILAVKLMAITSLLGSAFGFLSYVDYTTRADIYIVWGVGLLGLGLLLLWAAFRKQANMKSVTEEKRIYLKNGNFKIDSIILRYFVKQYIDVDNERYEIASGVYLPKGCDLIIYVQHREKSKFTGVTGYVVGYEAVGLPERNLFRLARKYITIIASLIFPIIVGYEAMTYGLPLPEYGLGTNLAILACTGAMAINMSALIRHTKFLLYTILNIFANVVFLVSIFMVINVFIK